MTPEQALWMLGVPGVVTLVVMLGVSLFPTRVPAPSAEDAGKSTAADAPRNRAGLGHAFARSLPAIVAAAALFAVDFGLNQWHAIWPVDGTQRFLAVAIAAGVLGVIHSVTSHAVLTALLRALLGAGLALAVLTPLSEMFMPRGLLIGLTITSGLWLAVAGGVIDGVGGRLPRYTQPAVLIAVVACSAPGLFLNTYAGGAMLVSGLGSIAGGVLVVALIRGRCLPPLAGLHTVWLAVFGSILLVTFGYQEKAVPWSLIFMAIAPLGVLAGLVPKRALVRAVLAAVTTAVIAGIGVVIVGIGSAAGDEPSEDSYYSY